MWNRTKLIALSFFSLVSVTPLVAQIPSESLLELENTNGLLEQDKFLKNKFGEARLLKQQTNQVYIITKEEILNFGYITLVDALANVPGMKVSQPGSARDGEMFSFNGLVGNQYYKILINGIPIDPFATAGFPIGAQLPIKEAERIEVNIGANSAEHGDGAILGTINIVLKESDRPIYANASMTSGALGTQGVNVIFGTKIGRGRNLVTLSAWGSQYQMKARHPFDQFGFAPVSMDPFLYSPGDTSFIFNDNYIRKEPLDNNNFLPLINELPSFSTNVGFDVKFRNLNFQMHRMYRRDHAALGYQPTAISYSDPSTFIGDLITRYSLSKNYGKRRLKMAFSISSLLHQRDPQSTTKYINPDLRHFILMAARDSTFVDELHRSTFDEKEYSDFWFGTDHGLSDDEIYQKLDDYFFSNRRYQRAESGDMDIDISLRYDVNNDIKLYLGSHTLTPIGVELIEYNSSSLDNSLTILSSPNEGDSIIRSIYLIPLSTYSSFPLGRGDNYLKGTADYDWGGLKLVGSLSTFGRFVRSELNLGGYILPSPSTRIFANMSTGSRNIPSFYSQQTFYADARNILALVDPRRLENEETISWQVGGEANWNGTRINAGVFYSKTTNIPEYVSYGNFSSFSAEFTEGRDGIGYRNDGDWGASIEALHVSAGAMKNFEVGRQRGRVEGGAQYAITSRTAQGKEADAFYAPNVMANLKSSVQTSYGGHYAIAMRFNSSFKLTDRKVDDSEFWIRGFPTYLADVSFGQSLSDQLRIDLLIRNMFNSYDVGINADETPNALLVNTAYGTRWQLRIAYNLD